MKNRFSIVFPCFEYVSTVMRSALAEILVPPHIPGFDVRAQHDPEKRKKFIFCILTQKVLIRLLNIFVN